MAGFEPTNCVLFNPGATPTYEISKLLAILQTRNLCAIGKIRKRKKPLTTELNIFFGIFFERSTKTNESVFACFCFQFFKTLRALVLFVLSGIRETVSFGKKVENQNFQLLTFCCCHGPRSISGKFC